MSTSFTLVQGPQAKGTNMTSAVIAGRYRGVFDLRSADEADLSIVGVIGGCGDLFRAHYRGVRL